MTEIPWSVINDELRYEAEFFWKRYLQEDTALSRWPKQPIGQFASVTDGPHGYHVVDASSPIVMLTAKNAKDWFSEREGADPIAEWVDTANKRSSLEAGNVILSTRGTVGMCALVTEEVLPANIDQDVARISWADKQAFLPGFVVAFLNSSYGQDHIVRYSSGMVQQGLSLQKVREIAIPILSFTTQDAIATAVGNALIRRRQAVSMGREAELTLLRALGLENWQPPEPLTYTRRASEAFAVGRLDADYFQPKYQAMLKIASQHAVRVRRINDFAIHCARGEQPAYATEGTLAVVNSRHILENGLDYDNFERTDAKSWDDKKFFASRIKRNDILTYTTGAKVGRTALYLDNAPALASNHVNLLRTNEENSAYVATVMNSMIGRWQTQMVTTGSAQVELYPNDISQFVIPFVKASTEEEIVKSIQSAHTARRQVHALLDAAKRAVEIAIEHNEQAALEYLTAFDKEER